MGGIFQCDERIEPGVRDASAAVMIPMNMIEQWAHLRIKMRRPHIRNPDVNSHSLPARLLNLNACAGRLSLDLCLKTRGSPFKLDVWCKQCCPISPSRQFQNISTLDTIQPCPRLPHVQPVQLRPKITPQFVPVLVRLCLLPYPRRSGTWPQLTLDFLRQRLH